MNRWVACRSEFAAQRFGTRDARADDEYKPRRVVMESIDCIQDCSLVREAQGGSQAAFEQLVHTYDEAVLRLALRLTGSESDAQDIHQETFLKVYKKLGGFRFECSFSTWIYRIVTNVCLDHLRRNRARSKSTAMEVNDNESLNQLSDDRPGNNPERQLLDQELSAQILRALQRLTPRERMVFDLRHFQGLNAAKRERDSQCVGGVGQDDFLPGHAEAALPAR